MVVGSLNATPMQGGGRTPIITTQTNAAFCGIFTLDIIYVIMGLKRKVVVINTYEF